MHLVSLLFSINRIYSLNLLSSIKLRKCLDFSCRYSFNKITWFNCNVFVLFLFYYKITKQLIKFSRFFWISFMKMQINFLFFDVNSFVGGNFGATTYAITFVKIGFNKFNKRVSKNLHKIVLY
jgi:hypothetical protein